MKRRAPQGAPLHKVGSFSVLHDFIFGLLLGWGAAIPIGPMNLEIIRRNLRYGFATGALFGLGLCSADLVYLMLLSFGALVILQHPLVLRIVSLLGAGVLFYFVYLTLKQKPQLDTQATTANFKHYGMHTLQGFLMTCVNPMTILFWSSVSATVAMISQHDSNAVLALGLGVFAATCSWMLSLNTALHFVRHRLSVNTICWMNYSGALFLTVFALISLYHAFK